MNYPKPFRREGQTSLWFNYVDPLTGKRRLKSTGTSKVGESKEYIQAFMDRLTPAGSATFRSYAEKFFSPDTNPRYIRYNLAGLHYSKGRCKMCKSMITRYVFPEKFSDMKLSDITRGDVLDIVSLLARKHSDKMATVNKVIDFISSIFAEAYFRGDLKFNPAQMLGDIEYEHKKRGAFTISEIRDMFSDPDRWISKLAYYVFMFAAYTGRRAGEIFGLQWSQIKDGYLYIDRAYNQVEKAIIDPKWGKSVTIPLCKTLVLPPKGDCPYVFHTKRNKPIYMAWWKRNFNREMNNLGFDIKGRGLVPHSFRHSLNTNLIVALGGQELFVRKYIGWSDIKDTQAGYTHIKPEDLKFIADKIDDMYNIRTPGFPGACEMNGRSKDVRLIKV